MISQTFRAAVKLSELKQYEIARAAKVHHTVLSKILNGIDNAKPGDVRVLKVAKVLGLKPEDCFALDNNKTSLCRKDTEAK